MTNPQGTAWLTATGGATDSCCFCGAPFNAAQTAAMRLGKATYTYDLLRHYVTLTCPEGEIHSCALQDRYTRPAGRLTVSETEPVSGGVSGEDA